jgi:hypothetical protein
MFLLMGGFIFLSFFTTTNDPIAPFGSRLLVFRVTFYTFEFTV